MIETIHHVDADMAESQILYKYRPMNSEFTEDIFRECRMYYPAPSQLNDPFDCRFQVSMINAPLQQFKNANGNDLRTFVEAWFRDESKNDVCVFSLSATNSEPLMWSHYADHHKGICIGIKVPSDNELHQIRYEHVPGTLYFADLFPTTRNDSRFKKSIIDILTTKGHEWSYEKEWRCIEFGGKGPRPLPNSLLQEVIFGCRTSESDKQLVKEWLGPRCGSVRILEARMKERAFELEIVPA
jgi:hypothetical protein